MKKGISYWSFGADLGNGNPSYDKVFKLAKKLGFDTVEASVSNDPASIIKFDTPDADLAAIKTAADAAGIEISSVASGDYWGVPATSSDESVRSKAVSMIKDQLRIAAALGAKFILVVPGAVKPPFIPDAEHVPYALAYQRATNAIKACVATAVKYKVVIGVEIVWNRMLLSPLETRAFCKQFDSDYVKCYLDVGNVLFNGFPQDWIKILTYPKTERSYLAGVHIKDFKHHFLMGGEKGALGKLHKAIQTIAKGSGWTGAYSFCDIGAGDLPCADVIAALKEANYNGPLTAEMLPPYKGVLAKTSKTLDELLGRAEPVAAEPAKPSKGAKSSKSGKSVKAAKPKAAKSAKLTKKKPAKKK